MSRSPLLFALLLACAPALAQNPGAMMPDGSTDTYVGLAAVAGNGSKALGGQRQLRFVPLVQVMWSNGIFMPDISSVGIHLSKTAGIEYGLMASDSNGRRPTDSRELAGTREVNGSLDASGFFNVYLRDRLRFTSGLRYDSSAQGMVLNLGLQQTLPAIAQHHTVSLSLGLSAADGKVMREQYSVSAPAGPRDYQPGAGLLSVNANLSWNWELDRSWIVHSSLSLNHLGKGPANSPVTEGASTLRYLVGLGYRF
ncbi:MipA/OmpV family protein [Oxalobacteraceae bacterium]|nr:MipA/OmpV family protein [Oxalobacteraceae bacterium]